MYFIIHSLIGLAIMYFLYKHALNKGFKRGMRSSDSYLRGYKRGANKTLENLSEIAEKRGNKQLAKDFKKCKIDE